MRKVIAATFVSLDGVMQAPGGPEEDPSGGFKFGGWTFPHFDEEAGGAIGEMFAEPFDLLLGRRTYDIFNAYWPYHDEDPIGRAFNACTKYVATRSDKALSWENTVALRGEAAETVAKLKAGEGPTLLIQGSSVLIHTLQKAGLIDVYQPMIFPVVLGNGKRLFDEGAAPQGLKVEKTQVFPSGVILARYTPAGEVPVGSFADEKPNEAELARRAAWARES